MPVRMLRRTFLGLSGSTLATGVLAACGGPSESQEVRYWTGFNRPDQKDYAARELVSAFVSSAGVRVSMALKPGSTINRLVQIAVTAGVGRICFLPLARGRCWPTVMQASS